MADNIDESQVKWDNPPSSSNSQQGDIDESQITWDTPEMQVPQSVSGGNDFPKQSGQNAPSPLNPIQSGAVGLVNNPSNVLQALLSTGVNPKRITLGDKGETLVDGVDINKTGLNNVNDFAGKVARGLTRNLPLLSQVGGDVAAGLLAPETAGASLGTLAAFNAATSATGEAVRQLASKGISGENFSGSSMAAQAGIGAVSPYVGKVLETAYNGTKMALLNTLDKVASREGIDGLVAMGNHLVSNLDPKTTIAAIDKVRNGDLRILDDSYADEGTFQDTLHERLFGKDGNVASHIQKNYASTPAGAQAAKELYSHALGIIPEQDIDTILKQGSSVNRMIKPGALTALGEDIGNAAKTLLDVNGKNLGAARKVMLSQAAGVQMKLSDVNNSALPDLIKSGHLINPKVIGNKTYYELNPDYAVTPTGKAQKNMFDDLIDRFFDKKTVNPSDILERAGKGDTQAIAELANMRQSGQSLSRSSKTLYSPDNDMTYGEFNKRLSNIDTQISGNEFDKMGDLSPTLAGYLKGLRGETNKVAQQVGNKSVPFFNAKYGELADTLSPVMKAARDKDGLSMENYMKSIANNSSEKQLMNGADINNLLKKEGVHMFDDLDAYRASQSLKKLESPIVRSQVTKKFGDTLESAYTDNPKVGVFNSIKQSVDSGLPKDKQFSDLAETHVLAKALNKDTTNIFKAGFLSHGLDIGGIVGGVTGGFGGAAIGATVGTAAGLALQKPAIRKGLIEMAARRSGKLSTNKIQLEKSRGLRIAGNAATRALAGLFH